MIRGKQIILRTMRGDDLRVLNALRSNYDESGDYTSFRFIPETALQKEFEENRCWGEASGWLLIAAKDHPDSIIGSIGYFGIQRYMKGFEIGYSIYHKTDRGKGYMTEALRLLSAYLFETHPIPRLQVAMDAENRASRRVAEKCGYSFEGTLRQCVLLRGVYRDMALYSLLREECPSLKTVLGR